MFNAQSAVVGHARAATDRERLHSRSKLRRRQLRSRDPLGERAAATARQEERRVRKSAEHLQVPHGTVSARD